MTRVLAGLLLGACLESPTPPAAKPPEVDTEGLATPRAVPPGATVVSFTFSDTPRSLLKIGPLFGRYGMRTTIYVSSGRVGRSGFLTLDELRALTAAGHEVGSHTVDHVDLSTIPLPEARHQICDDRVALMGMGFPVTSFCYPFSVEDDPFRQIVIDCNFNSARTTGGIRNPHSGCTSCAPSERIPPVDPFRIRAVPITDEWTLADLQSLVLQTENAGGGWMVLSLHGICGGDEPCDTSTEVAESLLDSFLAWLAPRASRGTLVMTENEVIGGPVKPPVALPLPNASLETDNDSNNVPDCWKRQNTGSTEGGWLRTSDAHSGSWAQRARISSYSSGDRRLVVEQDSGACAPAATPGRSYRVSAWYKTDSRAAFVATYRTSSGTWVSWASGPDLPASSTVYRRGEWVTPPLPAGATRLSVGLALRGVGFLFMDDFTLERLPPTPLAPE